jgi:hypothetical protein
LSSSEGDQLPAKTEALPVDIFVEERFGQIEARSGQLKEGLSIHTKTEGLSD